MPEPIAFHEASSVADAVAVLHQYGADAKVVAGATALSIMLRQRLVQPRALVSIGRIRELREVRVSDDALVLGALVTHREVEQSALVAERIPVLAATFGTVANVRVRNAATVGGVVAEADYASDPPTTLLALDAVVEVTGPRGDRRVPIAEFILGFYTTALEPDEIVTAVRVPIPPPGTHGVYEKFLTRSSEDRPCVGVAAVVRLDAGGACVDLRVALGATSERPFRDQAIERSLLGAPLDEDGVRRIATAYAAGTTMLDDVRGSAWYRRTVAEVWLRRAIVAARDRALAARHA